MYYRVYCDACFHGHYSSFSKAVDVARELYNRLSKVDSNIGVSVSTVNGKNMFTSNFDGEKFSHPIDQVFHN